MDDGTWGFLMTLQRLDNETLPEEILAVLRVLHKKNLSSSFDLYSLGSKTGPGGLLFEGRCYFSEVKPSCCLSVISSIFMLHFWQICLRYLTQRFPILRWKQGTYPRPEPTAAPCSALRNKSNAAQGKFDWDFVWPLNWVDGARAWLWANTASNGE